MSRCGRWLYCCCHVLCGCTHGITRTHHHNTPSFPAQLLSVFPNLVLSSPLFSTQSISRQSQTLFSSKSRPSSLVYIALLLGISWDVELNPGPDSISQESIYPCGTCQNLVTWEQNSMCCDTCDVWFHKDCLSMSTTLFTHLTNSDTSWLCPTCENPNFSSVLFNTPITDSNDERYTILFDSMKSFNISNISPPTSLRTNLSDVFSSPFADCSPGAPQATSSPHTNTITRLRTPVKDNMKLAIVNCNSIVNKIQEFQTFLSVTDPNLVLGTESWLKPDITNSEVFPPEYAVFRRDRKSHTKKSGGGVFILARKEYICTEIQVDTNCEFQAIELQLKDQQNVKVCNFYRPPWTDDSYFEDFIIAMQQVDANGKGNIWVGGDFNLPDIDWSDVKLLPGNVNVNLSNSLIDLMNDMALTQVVDHPTRKNSILDLFFTSNATLVNRFTTTPRLTAKADHNIVFVDLNTRPHLPKQSHNT